MEWKTWEDPAAFLDAAHAHLTEAPLVNQGLLGIGRILVTDPFRFGPTPPRMHTVHRGGACVGALLQTPPWLPHVSEMPIEVAAFAGANMDADGCFGPVDATTAFAAVACRGRPVRIEQRLGLFELTAVEPVRPSLGRHRAATESDVPTLQAWIQAFHDEATPDDPQPMADAARKAVERGAAHVWDDGAITAWANYGREVDGYISVGPVYTPPGLRGRGYATNLVAAMSTAALAQGRRGCTLFTDLSNPTSNAIYERIGYRRVNTMRRYVFP